mmetsp:Transcript_27873/g.86397  ORF Transcript_27873/g.86397 Transcript_27873/m.86397 type:complete len:240 (-) Transcript_27873:85-804(-)
MPARAAAISRTSAAAAATVSASTAAEPSPGRPAKRTMSPTDLILSRLANLDATTGAMASSNEAPGGCSGLSSVETPGAPAPPPPNSSSTASWPRSSAVRENAARDPREAPARPSPAANGSSGGDARGASRSTNITRADGYSLTYGRIGRPTAVRSFVYHRTTWCATADGTTRRITRSARLLRRWNSSATSVAVLCATNARRFDVWFATRQMRPTKYDATSMIVYSTTISTRRSPSTPAA